MGRKRIDSISLTKLTILWGAFLFVGCFAPRTSEEKEPGKELGSASRSHEPATQVGAAPKPTSPKKTEAPPTAPVKIVPLALPPADAEPSGHLLARIPFGDGRAEVGAFRLERGLLPPQAYVVTAQSIAVLDNAHQRVAFFDLRGRFDKAVGLPKLKCPNDFALTQDGTLAVVDSCSSGTFLLDAGGYVERVLPAASDEGFYAAGTNLFFVQGVTDLAEGHDSVWIGLPPTAVHEEENGLVRGLVAPAGNTVVRVRIEDEKIGRFSIASFKGAQSEMVFEKRYETGSGPLGYSYFQSSERGDIYVVLGSWQREYLLCVDGKNGDPRGVVPLPGYEEKECQSKKFSFAEPPHTIYRVSPSGGLVMARTCGDNLIFEQFECP